MTSEQQAGRHLLLVAGTKELEQAVRAALAAGGYILTAAADLDGAGAVLAQLAFDCVLVDGGNVPRLPPDALPRLRETARAPVFLLADGGTESGARAALRLGADEVLAKPLRLGELLSRVSMWLRSAPRSLDDAGKAVYLDPGSRVLQTGHGSVPLSGVEFAMLSLLAEQASGTVPKETLRECSARGTLSNRGVTVHISSLRKKLLPLRQVIGTIQTVYGVGYRMAPPGEHETEEEESPCTAY